MNYNNLSPLAQRKAQEDYIKDCILEDMNPEELHSILSHAPQYDYNEDGTLNKVI